MNITGPAVTFTTFTIVSSIRGSGTLLAAPAFTSITALTLVGTPLITLFQALPLIRSAVGSMTRIQEFLNQSGCENPRQKLGRSSFSAAEKLIQRQYGSTAIPLECIKKSRPKENDIKDIVTMQGVDVKWSEDGQTILPNINLTLKSKSLTMIIGPIGSGKSTLLKTILGETKVSRGIITIPEIDIAFCDQSPWLVYGTIRENITGITNSLFDESWYKSVLHACSLEKDLENLPDGEQTVIGSKGIALSGGQKQRVVSSLILGWGIC
jgi:ATP-binding cassette subfamily C (CFTR/MRP) protein 1